MTCFSTNIPWKVTKNSQRLRVRQRTKYNRDLGAVVTSSDDGSNQKGVIMKEP